MKKFIHLALALAATAACTVASAGVITFEAYEPRVYNSGEQFSDGPSNFTALGGGGVIVQGNDPFSCTVIACPVGNASKYFMGVNDGGLRFMFAGGSILLSSLDFSFVLPVDQLINVTLGQLLVTGTEAGGMQTTIGRDFSAQNGDGDFTFSRWDIGGAFAQTRFESLAFSACLYTTMGTCSSDPDVTQNQAQFAIDNIAFVPEPASLALVGVSLFGMFAAARRRKSV